MPEPALPLPVVVLALAAVTLIGMAALFAVASGPRVSMARRLASARAVRVADVLRLRETPRRPLRISGRVRSSEPIVTADGERLVVFHRTVEVRLPGAGWRPIERVRESRTFQLWDHAGELTIDPSACAEPMATIPGVWRGPPAELPDEYQPAIRRLESTGGRPASAARSETRVVNVIDRVLLLAAPVVDDAGRVTLSPPRGGYVLSTLELDEAMRVLVGRRALLVVAAIASGLLGIICALAGLALGVAAAL